MAVDGTLWFATIGDTGDDFGEVGPTGNSQVIYTIGSDTTPDVLPRDVVLDPANDLWFGVGQYSTSTAAASHTEIFVGSTATGSLLASQSPNPLESPNPSNVPNGEEPVDSNGVETFTLTIDTADKLIFATVGGNYDSDSGIYEYSYTASGALTDKGFAVTDAPGALQSAESDYYDASTHKLYVVDETPPTGYGEFDDVTNGILAYSASSSGALTNPVLLTSNAQFLTGNGSSASSYPNGLITAVTADSSPNGLIYFTTESYAQGAQQGTAYMTSTPQDTVWYISKTGGAGQTAHVLGNLSSTAFVNLGNYEEGLIFDPHGNGGNGTLYVSDQGTGDVVQINLTGGGTTVASINSTFFSNGGNTPHGLAFVDGPTVAFGTAPATYVGTASAEAILPGLSLSDPNGDGITSAVVTLTGGYAADGDVLSVSGSTSGFTVTPSGAGPTETLTISGTGTVTQYQTLLQGVRFATTTANPTNGGSNPSRTITVQTTDTGSGVGQGGDGGGVTSETLNLTALTKPTLSNVDDTTQQAVQGGAPLTLLTGAPTITSGATITGASVEITNAQAGDTLTFTLIGSIGGTYIYDSGAHTGTLVLNGSDTVANYEAALASVTYQDGGTDATAHPTRTINFSVSNSAGASTAVVDTVTIDHAPVTATHNVGVLEGATASTSSAVDSDADGDTLTVTSVDGSAANVGTAVNGTYGVLTVNANDTYSYVASNSSVINAAASGSHPMDTFSYVVSDGHGGTATETLSFAIDRPPVSTTHDATLVEGASVTAASAGDIDPDGDSLTVTAVTGGAVGAAVNGTYGVLTLNANDTYSYAASNTSAIDAAPTGSHPVDTFTYTVSDGHGGTASETLSISIDRKPTATTHTVSVVDTSAAGGSAGDSDPDGDLLTVTAVEGSAGNVGENVNGTYGVLAVFANDSYSYSVTNAAAIDAAATGSHPLDTFTYVVSDGRGGTATETLNFLIDRPPAVTTHDVSVDEGASTSASAGDSDPDGDGLTVTAVAGGMVGAPVSGTYGVLTLNADDTYSYTASNTAAIDAAAAGSHPVDTFNYTVSDGHGGSTNETLSFTIDRAPASTTHVVTVDEGATASASADDSDPDGDSLTVTSVQGAANDVGVSVAGTYGHLTVNSNDTYSYVADNTAAINGAATGSHLTDTFTYQVNDGNGDVSTETLEFVLDRPPASATHTVDLAEGGSSSASTAIDTDPDGDSLTVSAVDGSANNVGAAVNGTYGALTLNANDTYGYTASNASAIDAAADGSRPVDSFTYLVSDGHGGSTLETLNFVIERAPTAPTDGDATTNGVSEGAAADTTVGVTASSTDPDGDPVSYSLSADSSNGGFQIDASTGVVSVADGTKLSYADSGSTHSYSVTVQASDGTLSTSASFTIAVADVAPSIAGTAAGQAVSDAATLSPFSGVVIAETGSASQSETVHVTLSDPANGSFTAASLTASGFVADAMVAGQYDYTGTARQDTAAIQALVFEPTAHQVAPGSTVTTTFTVEVGDGTDSASDSTTTVVATATDTAPTLGGITPSTSISDAQTASPFSGVTVTDVDTGVSLTATVTPSAVANGVLSDANAAGDGSSVDAATGVYTVSGTAAQVQAALEGLVFTPTDHQVAPGSTVSTGFTLGLDDGHGGVASDSTTTVVATATDTAPTLGGITPSTSISDAQTASPFSGVTVSDVDTGVSLTATVTPSATANGALSDANAASDGSSVDAATGAYTVSGTAAQVQAALEGLVFTPTDHQVAPGSTVSTGFTVALNDGHGGTASDATTTVVATATDPAPTTVAQAASLAERTTTTGEALSGDSSAVVDPRLAVSAVSTAADGGAAHAVSASGTTTVQGAYGVLSIAADGGYSYAASAEGETVGASYADPFTLTVSDAYGATSSETLSFTSTGSAIGDANANTIVGGSGAAETLEGLGGADTLIAGTAADTFLYTSVSDSPYSTTAVTYDTIEGFRSGTDRIDVHAADGGAPVELVRDGAQSFVYFDPDGSGGYLGVVKVEGAVAAGDLVTSAGVAAVNSYVYGGTTPGQVLDGSAGHTTLVSGGASSDTLIGGVGDVMYGGSGADDFVIPSAASSPPSGFDTIADFTSGQDTLDLSGAADGAVVLAHENGVTYVEFDPDANGDGGYQGFLVVQDDLLPSDLKLAAGTTVTSYLYGASAAGQGETLDGTAGHMILEAGAGSDTLLGGPTDTLYAGSGADDFVIGALAASPASAYDVVSGFKGGTDKLDISAVDGGHVLMQTFEGATFVYFDPNGSGAYQGEVEVTGAIAASDLVLSSAAQANGVQIVGDAHEAASASETLSGGAGTDYIYAGSGADTLYGKGGADVLVGGAGADTYAYHAVSDSAPSAQDIIDTFDPAKGDVIDLSVLDQATGVTGRFVTSFDGHAGEYELVQPTAASSYWHVLGDLTGAGSADFEIAFNLTGTTTDYQSVISHIHL